LTSFGINDVHLDDSPTPVLADDDDDDLVPLLDVIDFKNMHNTRCVRQITDFLEWSSELHFTRCRLGPGHNGEVNQSMSLKEIDIGEDLVAFLAESSSRKLLIDNCPGFGDEVLNAMMTPEYGADQWTGRMLCCAPNVEDLSILNCPSFSISTLKKVVEMRRLHLTWIYAGIMTLRLSGRVPDVSSEDREWFKGHVSEFSYNPIPYA
jgi:hypothetical protein